jgi:hypothetical protein
MPIAVPNAFLRVRGTRLAVDITGEPVPARGLKSIYFSYPHRVMEPCCALHHLQVRLTPW